MVLKSIKKVLSQNKQLLANFSYLGLIQVINIVFPLFTIPYLLSVIGSEKYGLIVFAQSIISYFLILINFGFNLIGTKEISLHRDNIDKRSEVLNSIQLIKVILLCICYVILYVITFFVTDIENNKLLFYFTTYLCIFDVFLPIWYFQGIEKLQFISIFNLVNKLVFLILIFLFVNKVDDFLLVPVFNGCGALLACILATYIIYKKHNNKFFLPKYSAIKYYFNESYIIFIGSVAGKIKMFANKTILGIVIDMQTVAYYDIADKIKQLFVSFLEILTQALFPQVSKTKDPKIVRTSLKVLFLGSLLVYILSSTFLYYVIEIFFPDYQLVVNVFLVLGLLIIIQPISYLIASVVLVLNNLKKDYTINSYISTFIYLFLLILFYLLAELSLITASFSLVVSGFTSLTLNIYSVKKKGLINWIYLDDKKKNY
ncbi:oligosaccharide flippase family protein [Flammeovirga sp. SubArs3]|uniref:oligosaccharide flippase family protein n=1 Tax=Flammeovirga sp. SubArs3 TaxID=2995316 RepID=UPI00248AED3D|nr:oligosaccharide flippase family protein [Flammeovirga sp. SubArs3]